MKVQTIDYMTSPRYATPNNSNQFTSQTEEESQVTSKTLPNATECKNGQENSVN